MTARDEGLFFTLRKQRRVVFLMGLWALMSVLCGVMGPFGTHDVLPLLPRLGYWALICAFSIGASAVLIALPSDDVSVRALRMSGLVAFIGIIVHLVNSLIFDAWRGWNLLIYLWGIVGITAVGVEGVVWLIRYAIHAPKADLPAGVSPFLRRIPPNVRGPLVRVEAQDHYVLVVTQAGEALILMRFSDALAELAQLNGQQVHRSHYVLPDQVRDRKRTKDRDVLVMSDGAEIPVSRKFRPAVKELGLI